MFNIKDHTVVKKLSSKVIIRQNDTYDPFEVRVVGFKNLRY